MYQIVSYLNNEKLGVMYMDDATDIINYVKSQIQGATETTDKLKIATIYNKNIFSVIMLAYFNNDCFASSHIKIKKLEEV